MASLFSGLAGGLVLLILASVRTQWIKYRTGKTTNKVTVDTRLTNVEASVQTLNTGLFGEETPFGRTGGFVGEMRTAIKDLTTAVNNGNGKH